MSSSYQFEVTDELKSDVMTMSLWRQNVTHFVIFEMSDWCHYHVILTIMEYCNLDIRMI